MSRLLSLLLLLGLLELDFALFIAVAVAAGCLGQEQWASADRDLEESRSPRNGHHYWLPFGLACHHRRISHTPILGTAIRLIYGWWWLLPLLWLWSPAVAAAFCMGALVNDFGHLLLDL